MSEATQLSHEEVRAIAELAKLDLTDDEVGMFSEQLSQILGYFELLQQVDTSQLQATEAVLPQRNVLREDTVRTAITPEAAVANAPRAEANQFRVSAVLGNE